jgi:hypothetical protein
MALGNKQLSGKLEVKSQPEIEQISEQINELQSIRILMREASERIRNAEDEHLEEYLGSLLREIDQRLCDSESSPQHLPVRNKAGRDGNGTSSLSSLIPWTALGSLSSLIPWNGVGAMLAGLAWMVAGIVDATSMGGRGPEVLGFAPLDEALYCVALAGMLGGLVGLHTRQAPRYGRLGTVGFLLSFLGVLFLLIGLTFSFPARSVMPEAQAFLDQVLMLGFLGTLVGFVLLGAATLRLGSLPRWCGLLLITCLPLAITLGDYGGAIALGLIWLALAYVLLLYRDLSALLQASIESERVSEPVRN